MLRNFVDFVWGILGIFKVPTLVLLAFSSVFFILYMFWYIRMILSGKRPAPTSVRIVKRPNLFYSIFVLVPKQMVADRFSKPSDFFEPQGMIMFVGRQGKGKTIAVAEYMLYLQDTYPKSKSITNFGYIYQDDELKHWKQLTDYTNGKKGVIVGIDETQNWFSSNQSKNFPPEMLSVITQNRKNRRLILGTSQNFYLLAKAIRSQTTEVRECLTIAKCFTIVRRREPVLDEKGDVKEWKNRGFYSFAHTPRIRNSYDTYRVIESLVESGFKEESAKLEVNLL